MIESSTKVWKIPIVNGNLFALLTIFLVDYLCYTNDIALIITYWHRENVFRFVAGFLIDFRVKTWILVCIPNIDSIFGLGNSTRDPNTKRYDNLFSTCFLERLI